MTKKNRRYPLECECCRCGHVWIPRTEYPQMCPFCKSYYWDEEEWEDE